MAVTRAELSNALEPPVGVRATRLTSVDAVRGAVMVLMALDHARDFLHSGHVSPTDLAHTTTALFFTRWVTHFCAPAFMLLAGLGAGLSRRPRAELSRFLFLRGLWLVLIELTIVKFAWTFSFDPTATPIQVIWALGWSMVVLAALVWLPLPAVAAISLALIASHDLLDGRLAVGPLIAGDHFIGDSRDWVLSVLHVRNWPVIYPLIPWVAVMALGFTLGPIFRPRGDHDVSRRWLALLLLGSLCCAVFVVIRLADGYGDPSPWKAQGSLGWTLLSVLNTSKYPPSLDYLLMTLGPILLLLVAAERLRGPAVDFLVWYGRAPFFFYVAHLYVIHLLALLVGWVQGFPSSALVFSHHWSPDDLGFSLPGVYAAWAFVVVVLYAPCRWFARLKSRRAGWWWSYL
jgi:uncharacterized membrane protein